MAVEPTQAQQAICDRFAARPSAVPAEDMVGIGPMDGAPVNGLRHPPEPGTSGWFIWTGGEVDEADSSFFQPMHFAHLRSTYPSIVPYLALPPGWRFQIATGHEDVWFDESLLAI